MTEIVFQYQGREIAAREGESLAAALTQAGVRAFRETAKGAERGIFCGMGVCQDCLVDVDGTPNRRACMTPVENGMSVTRQVALPEFGHEVKTPDGEALHLSPNVLVVGGGAAGLSAAITAAEAGAEVVLLDERKVAGGQYYKQAANGTILDQQQDDGAQLVARAKASGARLISGVELWGAFDGLLFSAIERVRHLSRSQKPRSSQPARTNGR